MEGARSGLSGAKDRRVARMSLELVDIASWSCDNEVDAVESDFCLNTKSFTAYRPELYRFLRLWP
jgi:hypothetical protein